MFSFYGGKPGNSFVIVKAFPSVGNTTDNTEANNLSMVKNFSKGASYTQVHFGEYVIIDTEDKNDPDNGTIYKRGTNLENGLGGAEYFAQIVGPSGQAASIHFDTYQNVADIQSEQEGKVVVKNQGEYTIDSSLIAGKESLPYQGNMIHYNDTIKWKSCKIRDINNRTEEFYIGFQIPYPIFQFELNNINAYSQANIQKTDDGTHPFFYKWELNIPENKKANEIKDIRPIQMNWEVNIQNYPGRSEDAGTNRWIWVGDYYDYSESDDPTPVTIYLGDYDVIEDLTILDNGKIQKNYSHSVTSTSQNSIVKWPTNIHVDTGMTGEGDGDQKIYINWNDGTSTITGNPVNYIMEMTVDEQNRLLVRYSDPQKRNAGGITYKSKDGWTNIGQINFDSITTYATNSHFNFSNIVLKGLIKKQVAGNSILYTLKVTMPMTYPLNLENKLLKADSQGIYIKYNSNIYQGLVPSDTQITQQSQGLTFTITLPSTLINELSTSMQDRTIDCCDVIIEYFTLQLTSGE